MNSLSLSFFSIMSMMSLLFFKSILSSEYAIDDEIDECIRRYFGIKRENHKIMEKKKPISPFVSEEIIREKDAVMNQLYNSLKDQLGIDLLDSPMIPSPEESFTCNPNQCPDPDQCRDPAPLLDAIALQRAETRRLRDQIRAMRDVIRSLRDEAYRQRGIRLPILTVDATQTATIMVTPSIE